MKKEAEQYEEEDSKRVALVEAQNKADHLVDLLEVTLEDNPEQLVGRDEEVKTLLERVKAVRQDSTLEELEQVLGDLDALQHEIATELYSKVEEAEVPAGESVDSEVIDADFEEPSEDSN